MIPAASSVLALVLCACSIAVEYPIVRRMVGSDLAARAWPWVVRANVLSYLALVATTVVAYRSPSLANAMGTFFMPIYALLVEIVFRTVGAIIGHPR